MNKYMLIIAANIRKIKFNEESLIGKKLFDNAYHKMTFYLIKTAIIFIFLYSEHFLRKKNRRRKTIDSII